jgi:hypothetical protein
VALSCWIVRQCIQPAAILHLEFRERGDRIVPALDPAAPIDRTAAASDRRAVGTRGTIPRLTFGAGHGASPIDGRGIGPLHGVT